MMMVVAILSQSGGVGGVIVQVIGNVLVMVLEGLIVGIQVLLSLIHISQLKKAVLWRQVMSADFRVHLSL